MLSECHSDEWVFTNHNPTITEMSLLRFYMYISLILDTHDPLRFFFGASAFTPSVQTEIWTSFPSGNELDHRTGESFVKFFELSQ